jgi:hypothetical protein
LRIIGLINLIFDGFEPGRVLYQIFDKGFHISRQAICRVGKAVRMGVVERIVDVVRIGDDIGITGNRMRLGRHSMRAGRLGIDRI